MKLKLLLACIFAASTMSSSFGFMVTPVIRATGQTLFIGCSSTDQACTTLCGNASSCEVKEPYCRNCAGTQNLKLKRIFDGVGTITVATGDKKPVSALLQILKSGLFTSLHSMTIYNFSGQYDGDQVRGQFKYLCPSLPAQSEKMGILLIGLDPESNSPTGVIGAICPDEKTGEAGLYSTNNRWQAPLKR